MRLKNDPSPWEQVRVIANVARKSMRTAATAMNHCAGPRTTHDMDIAVTPGTGDTPRLRARFEPGGCVTGRLGAETCSPPRVTPPTRSTRKSANGPGPGTTRRPSIRPRSTGSFDGCTDPARARSGLSLQAKGAPRALEAEKLATGSIPESPPMVQKYEKERSTRSGRSSCGTNRSCTGPFWFRSSPQRGGAGWCHFPVPDVEFGRLAEHRGREVSGCWQR